MPLYCPFCGQEFTGNSYPDTKVKVQNHVRLSCKKRSQR